MTAGQHQARSLAPRRGAKLQRLLDTQENPIAAFRQALREGTEHLFARYDEGVPVGDLVQARSLWSTCCCARPGSVTCPPMPVPRSQRSAAMAARSSIPARTWTF